MTPSLNLTHHFLIAMPAIQDPIFAGTVTYVMQHDADGAMGLIVNRPLKLEMSHVFESSEVAEFSALAGKHSLYHGGPVSAEQGFILHRPTSRHWQTTLANEHLNVTTSHDILEAIAADEDPQDYLFCLGYSGWQAGQLESELKENTWLTVTADCDIIFAADESTKYPQALSRLGVDITTLSSRGGFA